MRTNESTFWKIFKKGAKVRKLRFPKSSISSEIYLIGLTGLAHCCEKLKKMGWKETYES